MAYSSIVSFFRAAVDDKVDKVSFDLGWYIFNNPKLLALLVVGFFMALIGYGLMNSSNESDYRTKKEEPVKLLYDVFKSPYH